MPQADQAREMFFSRLALSSKNFIMRKLGSQPNLEFKSPDSKVMKMSMNNFHEAAEAKLKVDGIDPAKVETKSTSTFEQIGP